MDIKALAFFMLALLTISGAISATVCKRRGIVGAKGMLKIALLIFLALFAGVVALSGILFASFPHWRAFA